MKMENNIMPLPMLCCAPFNHSKLRLTFKTNEN